MLARLKTILAALPLVVALACNDSPLTPAPPTDRFYFPTGIAVRHEPPGCAAGTAGCRTQLLVVSANFDLAYDPTSGGTLIDVDVDAALTQAAAPGAPSPLPAPILGVTRIGSFGGQVAILDPETCATWTGPAQALVASRSLVQLYRVNVAASGDLSCGDGCTVPLDSTLADPFGIAIACGTFPSVAGASPASQAFAFVTYLRSPDLEGWLTRVDLAATNASGVFSSPLTAIDMRIAPTGYAVFDPGSTRLYVSGRFAQAGYTPLRWIELASPGVAPSTVNLYATLRGSDLRGVALSSDRTRAYLAVQFYDPVAAETFGLRSSFDLAGALVVVDTTSLDPALPTLRVLNVIPLDRGLSELRVIPRAGRRDLVAIEATDDSTLTLYDDEVGGVATTLSFCGGATVVDAPAPAPCSAGAPALGANPFGLAVEPLATGKVRLYVGSFDRAWINVVEIDPVHPSAAPTSWIRIGPERI